MNRTSSMSVAEANEDLLENAKQCLLLKVEIGVHRFFGIAFDNTFVAKHLVDALVNEGLVQLREQAVDVCQTLVNNGFMYLQKYSSI